MSSAAFRIHSQTLSIETISERLNTQPSQYFEKGTMLSPRNPSSRRRDSAVWILDSRSPRTAQMETHLLEILAFVESKAPELSSLKAECSYDVFCAPSDGAQSVVLPAELLRRLQAVPVDLVIDIMTENS